MKIIYETFYDDGEYPDSLDYERQDDTGRACCVSVKLNCFTDSELQSEVDKRVREREEQIAREEYEKGMKAAAALCMGTAMSMSIMENKPKEELCLHLMKRIIDESEDYKKSKGEI